MYCSACGKPMEPSARFCPFCGQAFQAAGMPPYAAGVAPAGRLMRPRNGRMIAGVCAGLSEHYGWDLPLVRILTVVLALITSGIALFVYIAAWIMIPEGPYALPVQAAPPPPPPSASSTT